MSEQVKRYCLSEFAEPNTYPVGPGSYVATEDYDALHAETEALWSTYIALVDKLGIDTEKAKTADGKPSDVIVSYVEALRAENGRLRESSRGVRALAASLYQACGAYDMPERILDALSAAANGEPFTHMIDGLLPCVPPSGEGVQSLVEALEECAASLAWNCFGECRAIHAGPIMPAAMALDTARAALSTHRQAQRQ